MWDQTKFCVAKSLCKISALLRYYTTKSGNFILMFQDNISDPSSKVQKSKIDSTAQLKINDKSFFFFLSFFFFWGGGGGGGGGGLYPSSHFLKKNVLEASSVSVFMQRST